MRTLRFGLLAILAATLVAALVVSLTGRESAEATFPGENGKIAFSSDRDGDPEIYVMNPDGSGQTRLTTSSGLNYGPAWSPDGSRIAFVSTRDGNAEMYVMNADGSGQTRLTNNLASEGVSPSWSPDGSRIVFQSTRNDPDPLSCIRCNNEIYVMNADGSGQTRLTNDPVPDNSPAWSPDGSRIAFSSERADPNPSSCLRCNSEIYVMNTDGSGVTRVTNNPARDYTPNWSPDGSRLVFGSHRGDPNPSSCLPCNTEIYTMNADGSGVTRVTNSPADDLHPAWSPDGSRIVFTSTRADPNPSSCFSCNNEIFVMDAGGGGVTRLTDSAARDSGGDWQPLSLLGDVNCDRAVTIADAQLIAQKIVGRISALACPENGDVDGSGGVTIADAQLIAQLIVGRISSLPPP